MSELREVGRWWWLRFHRQPGWSVSVTVVKPGDYSWQTLGHVQLNWRWKGSQ